MLIHLKLLLLLQTWSDLEAGQIFVPLMSTHLADGIIESDIPAFHLVMAAVGFAMVVTAICLVMAIMQLEFGVDGVMLGIDVLDHISNDSSKLFVS